MNGGFSRHMLVVKNVGFSNVLLGAYEGVTCPCWGYWGLYFGFCLKCFRCSLSFFVIVNVIPSSKNYNYIALTTTKNIVDDNIHC